MKESIIKVILNFSFILPGSSQFINKDWHKGVSLSLSAVVGLLMFIFGGEKVSLLGFLVILFTWFANFIDIIGQAFKNSLHEISISLEKIAKDLKIIAVQLKKIDVALFEIEEKKFLPPRREFLLLPPGKSKRVIFLPGASKRKKS